MSLTTILAIVCPLTTIMAFFVFLSEHDDNERTKRELDEERRKSFRLLQENEQLKRRKPKREREYVYLMQRPCDEFHQYRRVYR